MNKKVSLGATIAFMLIIAAATFSITMTYSQFMFNSRMNDLSARVNLYDKFEEIAKAVELNYNGTINNTQLMDSVARGYIEGIGDEYAEYITAEEYSKLAQDLQGESVGIGAQLEAGADGYLIVREVYADSPAQHVGIDEGDLIIRVDDVDLTPDNASRMLGQISGTQGTTVSLTVRKGTEDVQVEPIRRAVVASSVDSRVIEGTQAGYVIIREFDENTSDQFNRELQKLLSAGITSLILDLRDNGGGNLRSAVRILDKLLPSGNLVTAAANRDGTNGKVLYTSDPNEVALPMVTLTNEGTANEAELFVQNLKDYEKGPSVGVTTAGKGVMQEVIQLTDGSAVKLTVAYYIPYSGVSYHDVGIKPDYEVTLDGDWTLLSEQTDSQLVKAVEVATALGKTAEQREAQEQQAENREAAARE